MCYAILADGMPLWQTEGFYKCVQIWHAIMAGWGVL
jgi:hypothetical protein